VALVGVVGAAVVVLTALLAFGLTRDPRLIRTPLIGRPAPDFTLSTLEGDGTIRLSDLRGQIVVLNFWASWCAACRVEHPNFVVAWNRYRDRGVVFLGVVYQDSPSAARGYMQEMGGDWPNVVDPDTRTALAYGVFGVPETFFIDRDGVIRHKQIGASSYDLLIEQIQNLLSAGNPA
jgi:cytochrome c biogenesis protein CcmG/thiol:disulfide interchange protein DsbE